MKNIHIFNDRLGIFLNNAYDFINQISDHNIFVNISQSNKNSKVIEGIKLETFCSILLREPIEKVYVHLMSEESAELAYHAVKNNSKVKIIWVFWSLELYSRNYWLKKAYLPYSINYLKVNHLRNSIYHFRKYKLPAVFKLNYFNKILKHVKYLACFSYTDYQNVCNYYKINPRFVQFAYHSVDESLKLNYNDPKILVNHNSDPILNHVEVIDLLSVKSDLPKVLIPLAYGDPNYAKCVKLISDDKLKNTTVEFLFKILDIKSYNNLLSECLWAIFNCEVQQGLGNIMQLLYMGTKVFLRKKSPMYLEFKSRGLIVFSVEEDLVIEKFTNGLYKHEIDKNRNIMIEWVGSEKIKEYYKFMAN